MVGQPAWLNSFMSHIQEARNRNNSFVKKGKEVIVLHSVRVPIQGIHSFSFFISSNSFNIYRNVVFVSAKETNTLQHFMNLQLETTPLCLESSSQAAEYLHSFLTLPSLAMDTKTVRSLARA